MINPLLIILFTIHGGYSMNGGCPANPGEFKYIASIQNNIYHLGSGVIIDEKHIITVAHVIADFTVEDLRVIVGTIAVISRWSTMLLVEEVYCHPDFESFAGQRDDTYYEHDIAVLRLERSLIWSPSVSQVPLVAREHDWGCHFDCILVSWDVPDDRRHPMMLEWESIKLMDNEVHQQWASYVGEHQYFFRDRFRTTDFGMEDLGGPIVCRNSLVGLVVQVKQLKIPEKPAIAMSIAPYLDFIDDIVHDGVFDVHLGEFPYIASIWYNSIYACGGFIVDATHVATVGHCVIMNYEVDNFTVALGYPPQWSLLANIAIHPKYEVKATDEPPNWYIDHDFALLTLRKPFLINQWTSPLPLAESDFLYVGQPCKLLRWKHYKNEETGADSVKLMSSHVIILNSECSQPHLDPSPQSQVPSFWGKSQHLIPMADHGDVGNPIICNGKPVGFLIQAIPYNGKTTALVARFLKMRPYIEPRNRT